MSPNGAPQNGILVAPNKRSWLVFSFFREFDWGYQNSVWGSSVWGHSESARKLIPSHLAFYDTRIKLYPSWAQTWPEICENPRSNFRFRFVAKRQDNQWTRSFSYYFEFFCQESKLYRIWSSFSQAKKINSQSTILTWPIIGAQRTITVMSVSGIEDAPMFRSGCWFDFSWLLLFILFYSLLMQNKYCRFL